MPLNIKPKVSVIIATHNRASLVTEAINSVLGQTFRDSEVIVVDDGSTDNTREVLKQYGSSIFYFYQENKGRAEARNAAIKQARGEYLAFLDDDDIWLPQKLEKQIAFLDSHPEIGLVHTFTEAVDKQGRVLSKETKRRIGLYHKAMKIGYNYEGMSRVCLMFISSVMLKRDCLKKIGLFDRATETFEDWDLYLRFTLAYRIATLNEPLVKFRIHPFHSTIQEFTQGRINVSKKHLKILDTHSDPLFRRRVSCNFYFHLANTYYIAGKFEEFRSFAWKVLRLNSIIIFHTRLGVHIVLSFLPARIIQLLRSLSGRPLKNTALYPERIIPEETPAGPLAAHLKRYEFARKLCQNKVVLDAACGVGYGSGYLAEVAQEVIGVDISPQAIAYAKEHYRRENLRFELIDVESLTFADKSFDVVCSFETLEHLDEPLRFISEARRVLKGKGVFILSTPHAQKTDCHPRNPYHRVELSEKDLAGFLKKHFSKVEIFGKRRRQSIFHRYLQRIDFLHLRAIMPNFLRKKICQAVATRSWDETGLEDFIIDKNNLKRATELIGVCRVNESLK